MATEAQEEAGYDGTMDSRTRNQYLSTSLERHLEAERVQKGWLGIDCDYAFINMLLHKYSKDQKLQFTCSRPYPKKKTFDAAPVRRRQATWLT